MVSLDPILLSLFLFAVFLTAGAIKGAVGMGLPTTALGLMTLLLDPRLAIALMLIPMLVSNGWQVHRSGDTARALGTYRPFAIALVVLVAVTVLVTADVPDRLLMAGLGLAILVFIFVTATRWAPPIADRHDRAAQVVSGTTAGVMGGLIGVWAPPLAVYLAARNTQKEEFVRASGLLIFLGSVPLALGYIWQGVLTVQLGLVGAALLVPTFAGFRLGEITRHKLSESAFRRLLLWVFFFMALNLLRRAFWASE